MFRRILYTIRKLSQQAFDMTAHVYVVILIGN